MAMANNPETRHQVIENTSQRAPLIHMAGMLGGSDRYIAEMERAGQTQLANSDRLPVKGSDTVTDLGIQLGDIDRQDPVFREVALPSGWLKESSDHAMWSYVLDEHGRRRVAIFYKASFYDRRAFCRTVGVSEYLRSATFDGQVVVLDDIWCTTAAVREAVPALIEDVENTAEMVGVCEAENNTVYASQIIALDGLLVLAGGHRG